MDRLATILRIIHVQGWLDPPSRGHLTRTTLRSKHWDQFPNQALADWWQYEEDRFFAEGYYGPTHELRPDEFDIMRSVIRPIDSYYDSQASEMSPEEEISPGSGHERNEPCTPTAMP